MPPEPPGPIRSYVPLTPDARLPPMSSGAPAVPVLAATMVLVRFAVPPPWYSPPPFVAEFPLIVQLMSVSAAGASTMAPPPYLDAEFPLSVQSVRVAVP